MVQLGFKFFFKFADENFVVCFSVVKELRGAQGSKVNRYSFRESSSNFFCLPAQCSWGQLL